MLASCSFFSPQGCEALQRGGPKDAVQSGRQTAREHSAPNQTSPRTCKAQESSKVKRAGERMVGSLQSSELGWSRRNGVWQQTETDAHNVPCQKDNEYTPMARISHCVVIDTGQLIVIASSSLLPFLYDSCLFSFSGWLPMPCLSRILASSFPSVFPSCSTSSQ